MKYTPRGNVKTILDTMAAQSAELEWSAQELADIAGIEKLAVSSTLRCALQHEAIFAQRRGREFVYSLTAYAEDGATEEASEPVPFNAALYLDGDLIVYGAQEMEDGGMLITKEQLAHLKKLIAWSPAP